LADKTMTIHDPIELLFGGMEKLGPGDDAHTLHVLRLLPEDRFRVVVDAGCGTGRQTMVLARELATLIHCIDTYEPFLNHLLQRAQRAGMAHLVQAHTMDMKDIPGAFQNIDLLWSEGAAYNIGFPNALATWAPALRPGGYAVISELSWMREQVPEAEKEFFGAAYPDMRSVQQNIAAAEMAGYKLLATHTLPRESWIDGYYDILLPRAQGLLDHPDPSVRNLASETLREIEVFESSQGSYGYVLYALQRP
jgi:trans-aconitate methyltransferase